MNKNTYCCLQVLKPLSASEARIRLEDCEPEEPTESFTIAGNEQRKEDLTVLNHAPLLFNPLVNIQVPL